MLVAAEADAFGNLRYWDILRKQQLYLLDPKTIEPIFIPVSFRKVRLRCPGDRNTSFARSCNEMFSV